MENRMGENIKECRVKKGLTQKQLGDKMGVSQAMVARYESKSLLKVETIQKIAKALDVHYLHLIDPYTEYEHEQARKNADEISAVKRLLQLQGYEIVIDNGVLKVDGDKLRIAGHGKIYNVSLKDLNDLQESTVEFFEFRLKKLLDLSTITQETE